MRTDTPSALSLAPLTYAGPTARWRTEAMRSHARPRLIHITKGQGRITISGLTTGYSPNNLIFIPPETMYGIEIGPTVFAQILTLPAEADGWPDTPFQLRLLDVSIQKELQNLMDALERETGASGDIRAAQCYFGLLGIFVERQLVQHDAISTDTRRNSASARLVAKYTQMIARDYSKDKSVADYAAALNVTPTHLTRSCKQTCERSALGLLNERIYFEACTLLKNTSKPVQEIASTLGFQSAAYFTRSFQSRAGQTPSEFRRHQRPVQ